MQPRRIDPDATGLKTRSSIYIETNVLKALDNLAYNTRKSRSYFVNKLVKEMLQEEGYLDDNGNIGKSKLD